MHFSHPQVLWCLLLLPALALHEYFWGPEARAHLRFSSLSLAASQEKPGPSLFVFTGLAKLAALALLIIALARPQEGQNREEVTNPATDIMLCVDTSTSMEALDFKPKNRLEAAKDVIQEFIKNRPHDRIGLVVFSGLAMTQCPLTLDHGALLEFLDNVQIGMIDEDGTAIGTAVALCLARLEKSEAKSKLIVLLTDGRNNRGELDPVTAAKSAAAFDIKIYAVGAGVPGGALYPVKDPFLGTRYVRLPEDLDEVTLRQMAETSHGVYFRATNLDSLKQIYREIDKMEKTDVKAETFTDYRDLYPGFIFAALFLLALEVGISQVWLWSFP